LPLELSALPLVLFHYYSTDICVPTDESFWTWLNAISDHRGTDVDCASGAPDLLVSSVVPTEITLVAGGSTETVTFTIHNAGDGEADSTTATIRASGDSTIATNDNQIGDTLAVPRLAASDSTRLAISFSAPAGLSPQVLYVGMCVERVSGESDADNNCSSAVEVTVVAGVTNLTNNSGKDSYPAWSPDGRSIAFTSNRDGNDDIHVMNADGTGVTRLTNSTFNYWSAWSPDGGRIAYGSSYGGGNYEIHVMNADGTGVTRLTNHSAGDTSPAWSPDGRRIAFTSSRDGNLEIYVMNADGTGVTRLTNHSAEAGSPTWSPDGRRIAFVSERDGNDEIYVMNADGTGVTRLTNHSAEDGSPTWSSDGRRIAFDSNRDGNLEIYVMNVPASGATAASQTRPDRSRPDLRMTLRASSIPPGPTRE